MANVLQDFPVEVTPGHPGASGQLAGRGLAPGLPELEPRALIPLNVQQVLFSTVTTQAFRNPLPQPAAIPTQTPALESPLQAPGI